MNLRRFLRLALAPLNIRLFHSEFKNNTFKLLDVGAGNHSAWRFCSLLRNCQYYAIDQTKNYNNDERDFALMKEFWEMDLKALTFESIPEEYFDAINMSHVIEHLDNGYEVISGLIPKLKKGGVIYIEFPGYWSTKLPSMRGTLNFFDDSSHVRIFSVAEIYNILMKQSCRPIAGGTRRNWFYTIMIPIVLPRRVLRRGYLEGADLWDLLGFAQYVFARRK